ncbi:MAG TPA: TIGR03435 family protein [Candidatus Acidoferrales bacterium]|nr:TIGR03435 family protein [Candidatus Acidoferrales bacterium]
MKFVVALGLLCITAASYRSTLYARQANDFSDVALTVTDQAGTPVPNAEVRLNPMPQNIDSIFTDTNGKLQLIIPAGDYELNVTEPGFMTARERVELGSGTRRSIEIALKIGASCPPGCPAFIASPLQSPAAAVKAATIKQTASRPSGKPSMNVSAGGRVVIRNKTLKDLIASAYNVRPWQISGGEDWTRETAFDIEIKLPGTTQIEPMLWNLLTERFHLQFHEGTKTGTVYLLRRSPRALQLRPAKTTRSAQQRISRFGGYWVLEDATLPQLAEFTSDFIVHGRVIDVTGLSGAFYFRSSGMQSGAKSKAGDNTSSFLAALDEMGLNLKSSKGPVGYFVIDGATRRPSN